MSGTDLNAAALQILERKFSPEWKNESYSLVIDRLRKFVDENKLKATDFPQHARLAIYVLALGVAKKNMIFAPDRAAKYIGDQLIRIRKEGPEVIEEIFREITAD